MVTSAKFDLIKQDGKKILKGAGIAAAGAVATILLDLIPGWDFGVYTPMVVAINSVICNAVLKYVTANKY